MPQFDVSTFPSMIFWLLVSFSIVVYYYRNFVLQRFQLTIEDRLNTIRYNLEQAQALDEQATELLHLCDQRILDAKKDAERAFERKCLELDEISKKTAREMHLELQERRRLFDEKMRKQHNDLEKDMKKDIQKLVDQVCVVFDGKNPSVLSDHGDAK